MYEQQSYDNATVQAVSQPDNLFSKYEIKSWEFSPLFYKILAASVVLHVAAIAFIAQTNILTMRGCDNPWVGSVCQVVDMAYVGAMLYGTDREFIDEAYENIDLGEADITYIDVTGETPPLTYPEGYFQIANPVQYAMLQQAAQNPDGTAGFPNSYQPSYVPPPVPNNDADLLKIRPNPPAADPGAFKDDPGSSLLKVEDPPASAVRSPRNRRNTRIRPEPSNKNEAKPDETQVAESNSNTQPVTPPTDPVAGPDINKRPMVDFGNWVNDKLEKKEVDLQTEFLVNARGKLDKNGRLDPRTFQWVQAVSADEDMVEVVKRAVESMNNAGYLQYLKDISGKDFNFQLQQDAENISAVVLSELESPTRAQSIKSSLDLAISVAKLRKQGEAADQNDKDDLLLLENAKVEVDGKRIVLKFIVPKAVAHPMIQRKLAEQAAELRKPSGLAPTSSENNTAIK